MLTDAGTDATNTDVLQVYLKNHARQDKEIVKYLIRVGASCSILNEYYFYKVRALLVPALIADQILLVKLMEHK